MHGHRNDPASSRGDVTKSPDDEAKLAALQARLLDRAVDLLKPGGRLVFCTCSLQRAEGEDHVRSLLARRGDLRLSPIQADETGVPDSVTADGVFRALPQQLPGDSPRMSGWGGFFAARLCDSDPSVGRAGVAGVTEFARTTARWRWALAASLRSGSLAVRKTARRITPGGRLRLQRFLFAPPDLRTADPTMAAEIYSGLFVFAGRSSTRAACRPSTSSRPRARGGTRFMDSAGCAISRLPHRAGARQCPQPGDGLHHPKALIPERGGHAGRDRPAADGFPRPFAVPPDRSGPRFLRPFTWRRRVRTRHGSATRSI